MMSKALSKTRTSGVAVLISAAAAIIAGCGGTPPATPTPQAIVIQITATAQETVVVAPTPTPDPTRVAIAECRAAQADLDDYRGIMARTVDDFADRPRRLNHYQAEYLEAVEDLDRRLAEIPMTDGTQEAHDLLAEAVDLLRTVGENAPPGGGTAAQVQEFESAFADFSNTYYEAKTVLANPTICTP